MFLSFNKQGAMYGMAQSIPDRSLVSEIAGSFFDAYYNTAEKEVVNGVLWFQTVTAIDDGCDCGMSFGVSVMPCVKLSTIGMMSFCIVNPLHFYNKFSAGVSDRWLYYEISSHCLHD